MRAVFASCFLIVTVMSPPSRVYLTALDKRFWTTIRIRLGSRLIFGNLASKFLLSLSCLVLMPNCNSVIMLSVISTKSTGSGETDRVPISIRLTLSKELTNLTMRWLPSWISLRNSFWRSLIGPTSWSMSISVYQLTAERGVLSWWEAKETNSVLALSIAFSSEISRKTMIQPMIRPSLVLSGEALAAIGNLSDLRLSR